MLTPALLKYVKEYQESAPIKLEAYAVKILKHESCKTWTFEELVDEFGLGYLHYMEDLRASLH